MVLWFGEVARVPDERVVVVVVWVKLRIGRSRILIEGVGVLQWRGTEEAV